MHREASDDFGRRRQCAVHLKGSVQYKSPASPATVHCGRIHKGRPGSFLCIHKQVAPAAPLYLVYIAVSAWQAIDKERSSQPERERFGCSGAFISCLKEMGEDEPI